MSQPTKPMEQEFQQKILFTESHANSQANGEPDSPVVLPEEAWQAIDEVFEEDDVTIEKQRPKWLWRIAGISFTAVIGYEMVDFFISGFSSSPIITAIYAILAGSVGTIALLTLFKELRGLRQYHRQQHSQKQAEQYLQLQGSGDSRKFCQSLSEQIPLDSVTGLHQQWQHDLSEHLNDKEVLTLYSRHVLADVDKQAMEQVAKFSTEAVVLVAISPIALVDMMILLWRNLRMLDKVAGLYGIRLGYWSRIRLIKQVFVNMVYAGASEIIADVGVDMLGVGALGKLSTRMAQGLGAGMLTAKLGIRTIKLCRPVPFIDNPPGIRQVRREVVNQVRQLMANTVSSKNNDKTND
ncbi:YcjF family protein [Thalassotalea mangrovi]|uniref:TIGR01620 family protein n=1 Tax=Thalassotalea mangrovi TaxID=2572245 RepID=A0A4U1B3U5_9GAMM|nr:TIGR01620 family protein [Thalassotalea mangrovi]TKB44689.1 TIGR01620 family protein [Thalassotalea mangrovi]